MSRSIATIAAEIRTSWARVYFGAVPYLEAMARLDSINDRFGHDDAKSIIRYFLANAKTWRGDQARAIKNELKQLLGDK